MKTEELTRNAILESINKHRIELKSQYQVRKIGVFGSFARDDVHEKSDLDILVEFDQSTFDNYMDLKFFLEDLFETEIDLVIQESLKSRIKPYIMKEVIYAEGL